MGSNFQGSENHEAIMSVELDEIEALIRALSRDDKDRLIRDLIEELDAPPDNDVEGLWATEIERRVREMNRVAGEALSLEDLKADLRARRRR